MGVIFLRYLVRGLNSLANEILPILFWLLLLFGFDEPYIALMTVLAALLHEAGHFAAIAAVSGAGRIRGDVSGFRIKGQGNLSYKEERIVYAMGPLFNILCAGLILLFFSGNEYLKTFAYVNTLTAISNLMPLDNYDGYNILVSFFKEGGYDEAERKLGYISLLFTAALCLFSILLFEYLGVGLWLFTLFFLSLTSKIKKML